MKHQTISGDSLKKSVVTSGHNAHFAWFARRWKPGYSPVHPKTDSDNSFIYNSWSQFNNNKIERSYANRSKHSRSLPRWMAVWHGFSAVQINPFFQKGQLAKFIQEDQVIHYSTSTLLKSIQAGLVVALVVGTPLKAQDSGFKYGVQVSLLMPQGTISDYGTGFAIGGFAEKVINEQWGFRGTVEYAKLGDYSYRYMGYGWDISLGHIAGIADAVFYGWPNDDMYLIGGIGYYNTSTSIKFTGSDELGLGSASAASSDTALNVGWGWRFRPNMHVEARYMLTGYKMMQATVAYRF